MIKMNKLPVMSVLLASSVVVLLVLIQQLLGVVNGFSMASNQTSYLSCLPSVPSFNKPDSMLNLLAAPMAGHSQMWGDNYSASLVTIDQPMSVSVNKNSGDVFFVDYGRGKLRRVNSAKIVSTVANIKGLFSVHVSEVNSDVYVTTMTQILKVNPSSGLTSIVAGSASSRGDSSDGTLATNALLNFPKSVHDTSSGLYFTDSGNHKVKLIGTDGKLTTVAGNGKKGFGGDGGKATLASLNNPIAVLVNSGNIFISDAGNSRVRKVVANGDISTVVATTQSITVSYPAGLAIKGTDLYVADNNLGAIFKLAGSVLSEFAGTAYGGTQDGTPATSAHIDSPFGLAVASNGDLLYTDTFNFRVARVAAADGNIYNVAGNFNNNFFGDNVPAANATFGYDVHLYTSGSSVFVSDTQNNAIRRIQTSTGIVTTVKASLNGPKSLVVKSNGDVIFAEVSSHVIRKLVGGTLSTLAGSGKQGFLDGTSASAMFSFPSAVALHASTGDIYVADTGNARIRKIAATNGAVSTVLGNGYRGFVDGAFVNALINQVVSIFVTNKGDVYFIDMHRVRKYSNYIASTLAGGSSAGFSGDGSAATNSTLNNPQSLVVLSNGDVIVADTGNSRLRLISGTDGTIKTIAGNGQQLNVADTVLAKHTPVTPRSVALSGNETLLVSDIFGNVKRLDLCSCPTGYTAQCSAPPVAPSPKPQPSTPVSPSPKPQQSNPKPKTSTSQKTQPGTQPSTGRALLSSANRVVSTTGQFALLNIVLLISVLFFKLF